MYKLTLIFAPPTDPIAFQDGWQTFLRLSEAMPGLRRETVSHVDAVLQGQPGIYMIHNLYFDSRTALEAALKSPAGQQAGAHLQAFTQGRVTILLAEHREAHEQEFRRSIAPPESPTQETTQ